MARFQKGEGGRPKGALNHATREIQEIAGKLLGDKEYQDALKIRLKEGKAPNVEVLLYHYKWGKPKDTLTVEGSESLAELLQVALSRGNGDSA